MRKLAKIILNIRELGSKITDIERRLDIEDGGVRRINYSNDERWLALGVLKSKRADEVERLALEVLNNFSGVSTEDLKLLAETDDMNITLRVYGIPPEDSQLSNLHLAVDQIEDEDLKHLADYPHLPEQIVEDGVCDYQIGDRVRALVRLRLRNEDDTDWATVQPGDLGTVTNYWNDEEITVKWDSQRVINDCADDEIELIDEEEESENLTRH